MRKQFFTVNGIEERDLTLEELKAEAKGGNSDAVKELVELKGGWASLTSAQKEKVTRLLLGEDVEL